MTHLEWLEWRRNGIGSSDAPIIMGVSPWKSPFQLWEEKVWGYKEQKENPSMLRGKQLEDTARVIFEKETHTILFPRNVEHPEVNWMRASLDGIDIDNKVLVEIKCPNKEDHAIALNKMVPKKYIPQCQHQLMVTGLPSMFYFSFDGKEGAIVEVKRDPIYIKILWEEEHKFWAMKESMTAPELTDQDFVNLEGSVDWQVLTDRWKIVDSSFKELEKERELLKENLEIISQGKNVRGNGLKMFKSTCKGAVDHKRVMEDFPDIPWEDYRKNSFTKLMINTI